jgi:hypothetical protein
MKTACTRISSYALLACAGLLWLACTSAQAYEPTPPPKPAAVISYAGGDGTSIEKAVVILGADEMSGVKAEYTWLSGHYPGWKGTNQSLLNKDGKVYDVMDFTLPDGSKHTIYFDITDYFGKM